MHNMYEYSYVSSGGDEAVLVFLILIWLVMILAVVALGIVTYVFHSVGLYSIAKRRGIHHPWLAWIPVGSSWILGSVSDQYHYVTEGKVCNRRKLLLALSIASQVLVIVMMISYGSMMVNILNEAYYGTMATVQVPALLGSSLGISALAIVICIFQYMAYYDLFKSCSPNSAMVFLLVGIFIAVTLPFFVFACRKKDEGMPPRRRAAAPFAPQNFQPVPVPIAPTPAAPAVPSAPVPPVAPTEPVAPATPVPPVAPTEPVAPAAPVPPVAPTAPVEEEKPEMPEVPSAPETHETEENDPENKDTL